MKIKGKAGSDELPSEPTPPQSRARLRVQSDLEVDPQCKNVVGFHQNSHLLLCRRKNDDSTPKTGFVTPNTQRIMQAPLLFSDVAIPWDAVNVLDVGAKKHLAETVQEYQNGRLPAALALRVVDHHLAAIVTRQPEYGVFFASFKDLLKDMYATYAANEYYWITKDNTPMSLLGGVSIKDWALPWDGVGGASSDVSGTGSAKKRCLANARLLTSSWHYKCAICQSAFGGQIRTLMDCTHTFCAGCIDRVVKVADQTDRLPQCPTCRGVFLWDEIPQRHEAIYNKMLLHAQDKGRRYKCPFDGCLETFLKNELESHVDQCGRRKVICSGQCQKIITMNEKHDDCCLFWYDQAKTARDVAIFIGKENAKLEKLVCDLGDHKTRLLEQVEELTYSNRQFSEDKKHLEATIHALQRTNKESGGGGVEEEGAKARGTLKRSRHPPAKHSDFLRTF